MCPAASNCMTNDRTDLILHHLDQLVAGRAALEATDSELLALFANRHDEAAFEALVRRHGSMVLRVAQRVLANREDAQDVFQATFFTLARRAASIRKRGSVAAWLHGVAHRLALKALAAAAERRARQESRPSASLPDPLAELTGRELCDLLDAELHRLPERCRAAWVLCHLEGMTQDEAARQLGVSLATLKRRLEQGRELLCVRLGWRGLSLSAVLSAAAISEATAAVAVPPALLLLAVKAGG